MTSEESKSRSRGTGEHTPAEVQSSTHRLQHIGTELNRSTMPVSGVLKRESGTKIVQMGKTKLTVGEIRPNGTSGKTARNLTKAAGKANPEKATRTSQAPRSAQEGRTLASRDQTKLEKKKRKEQR